MRFPPPLLRHIYNNFNPDPYTYHADEQMLSFGARCFAIQTALGIPCQIGFFSPASSGLQGWEACNFVKVANLSLMLYLLLFLLEIAGILNAYPVYAQIGRLPPVLFLHAWIWMCFTRRAHGQTPVARYTSDEKLTGPD
ncbi:hypothetical protein CTRI78_v000357 [Colletotrichum trifolii]|uniref:Uncharacterized protein n=1 Tax=Colletotrichum trifolii TaxID=5466 RepID=A0A4R8RVY6_COLTR|nr:hypothetical protein CTRI78_v000357 [Colletotrichum trifolii]